MYKTTNYTKRLRYKGQRDLVLEKHLFKAVQGEKKTLRGSTDSCRVMGECGVRTRRAKSSPGNNASGVALT